MTKITPQDLIELGFEEMYGGCRFDRHKGKKYLRFYEGMANGDYQSLSIWEDRELKQEFPKCKEELISIINNL